MIIVRVELHSAITGRVSEIARMNIANIGGTKNLGDYDVATLRGRDRDALSRNTRQRSGEVKRHPRLAQHVWNLVAKALTALEYGK